jgi:F-type H+-transporting ATPase subunit a
MHEIFLRAEPLFRIGSFEVTNTLLLSSLVVAILVVLSIYLYQSYQLRPTGAQNVVEFIIDTVVGLLESIFGNRERAERYFPFIATIFIFILFSNWFGILPGVGSLGFYEHTYDHHEKFVPFLRSPASDLNFTLALAIIAVVAINAFGIAVLGIRGHVQKFLNFSSPIGFFIGVLEFIAEIARIISFSFRLFGNVFAGEVLLVVVAFLVPYVIPLPFLFMEIFVGLIQAFVFAMLTAVFTAVATAEVEHH